MLAVHYAGDLRGRHGGQRAARGADAGASQEHPATRHWNCLLVRPSFICYGVLTKSDA